MGVAGSCQYFFLSGVGQVPQFCSAKLMCKATLPNYSANGQKWLQTGKIGRNIGKYGRNQPKVTENRQKAFHFCPAKLTNFSGGEGGPPPAPMYVDRGELSIPNADISRVSAQYLFSISILIFGNLYTYTY